MTNPPLAEHLCGGCSAFRNQPHATNCPELEHLPAQRERRSAVRPVLRAWITEAFSERAILITRERVGLPKAFEDKSLIGWRAHTAHTNDGSLYVTAITSEDKRSVDGLSETPSQALHALEENILEEARALIAEVTPPVKEKPPAESPF